MNSPEATKEKTQNFYAEVLENTSAKLRKFLYELAEGTRDYRSLHNLTEQVEHQYHGRFVIELIQNAHDALVAGRDVSRIELSIRNEGPHGVLYVANDGAPFTRSNFESLSQLGNSDKNPQDSIGNKGIGFRSVLEISKRPAIYSRSMEGSECFDGYCFRFSPNEIQKLHEPICELFKNDDSAAWRVSKKPLVDWDRPLIDKFRKQLAKQAEVSESAVCLWVEQELSYLSPYMLPVPVGKDEQLDAIRDYEKRGFSTVIRLPLKSDAALELARLHIESVDSTAMLFLSKVSHLTLNTDNGASRSYSRRVEPMDCANHVSNICIGSEDNSSEMQYRIWTKDIPRSDFSDDVEVALKQLPGKWSELQSAAVSVAVKIDGDAESGKLSIFLPTSISSGCWAHINAPFFGDMSRTLIDFGGLDGGSESPASVYNEYLLSSAADLCLKAVNDDLAGASSLEANAILDLLSVDLGHGIASQRWQRVLQAAATALDFEIVGERWMLSNDGWVPLNEISLLPDPPTPRIINRSLIASHASFSFFTEEANSRRIQIENLNRQHDYDPEPEVSALANTLESIAQYLHSINVANWNDYWADVDEILRGKFECLQGKEVLIGNDGSLHAASDTSKVFFAPRQGLSDDEEVENEGDVKDIPESLRPYVAFLSDDIQVYEGSSGRQETRLRKLLLSSKLVNRFRREDIFSEILLPKTPKLPIKHRSKDSLLCRDILAWGLQLLALLLNRGKGDRLFPLLERLPAPCVGGWFPLCEASFGAGWQGTYGDLVDSYLSSANTDDAKLAHARLLLPPSDSKWGQLGERHSDLLRKAGVFDGLRLVEIKHQEWSSQFSGGRNDILMPRATPPNCSSECWSLYREEVNVDSTPYYSHGAYRLEDLYWLPGLDAYTDFEESTRIAFMEVILASGVNWPEGWHQIRINRIEGYSDSFKLKSLVAWQLERFQWLGSNEEDNHEWNRPSERWYVPTEVSAGRRHHFSHLSPLVGSVTDRLSRSPDLVDFLENLGMPRYSLDSKGNSLRLLNALCESFESGVVENADVFLGQVRAAWAVFEPDDTSEPLPPKLLVQRNGSDLQMHIPEEGNPVYLPDYAKYLDFLRNFDLPILAIETRHAKRLVDHFDAAYLSSVVRTSSLRAKPLASDDNGENHDHVLLRDDEELKWLPPALLAIAAYHGPRASGTSTKIFQKQILTFRKTMLSRRNELKIQLYKDDEQLGAALPVVGYWDQEESHLELVCPSGHFDNFASASETFASMLEREDLDVPIKLLLRETGSDFDSERMLAGLADLGISEDQYGEVQEFWRGDVKLQIEWLIPAISLLAPDRDLGELHDARSENDIARFLNASFDAPTTTKLLRDCLHSANKMFEFGYQVYEAFGAKCQLQHWNRSLTDRQLKPLRNQDYPEQFKVHLDSMLLRVRCLLAYILHGTPDSGRYSEMYCEVVEVDPPEELGFLKWEVEFSDVYQVVASIIEAWNPSLFSRYGLASITSLDDFSDKLNIIGVRVDRDPANTRMINNERMIKLLKELQVVGLSWAIAQENPKAAQWEGIWERFRDELAPKFEPNFYFEELEPADLWLYIMELEEDPEYPDVYRALSECSNIAELKATLGISESMLANTRENLKKLEEETRRKERLVNICGHDFDSAEDNLGGLWRHINDSLSGEILTTLPEINFRKTSPLDIVTKDRKRARTSNKNGRGNSLPRVSKAMEHLIGLSGEIHAFRKLQLQYGNDTVNATSWRSSYSATIGLNEESETDDSLGCDFIITAAGAHYYIEVKSSYGVQESFKMGSSEIRLATRLAKKHAKGVYLILRVNEALSESPTFDLLPNPFDPRYESQFEVIEADARIRYKRAD